MKREKVGSWQVVIAIALAGAIYELPSHYAYAQELKPEWKEGLRFFSPDGAFEIKVGGRVMNDWAFQSWDTLLEAEVNGPPDDGTGFRRARVEGSGYLYDRVDFAVQYDFAGSSHSFKDVYLSLTALPTIGNVRVGHFKEPMSLEELTSSKYITFMERSLTSAFVPAHNTGIMVHNNAAKDRVTWAAGLFREADGIGVSVGDHGMYNVTARLTGVPVIREEGKKLVHLGVAGSYQERDTTGSAPQVRFRARPEANMAPRFVDTGSFDADAVILLGGEGAAVLGPASVQGEFIQANVSAFPPAEDATFSGFYAQASVFLTGEYRKYKNGTFSRVKPKKNFLGKERNRENGAGAVELALRYSALDLEDTTAVSGAEDKLSDITAGVNWYLNPVTRVMVNVVLATLEIGGVEFDQATIIQTRFQIDF